MKLFKCLLLLCVMYLPSSYAQRQIIEAGFELLDVRDNAACGNLGAVRGLNMLEISIGDARINARIMDCHDFFHSWDWDYWDMDYNYNKYDAWFNSDYVNTRRFCSGSYTLNYQRFLKWWLQAGIGVTFCNYRQEYVDSQTGAKAFTAKSSSVSVLPNVRFNYFNRRYFGLYSAVGMGFNVHTDRNYHLVRNKGKKLEREANFMAQATFIGVRFGAKLYVNAELGVGPKGIVNAGLGYRF